MQLSKGKHGPNRNDIYLVPLLEAEPYSHDHYKIYHDSDEPWFGGEFEVYFIGTRKSHQQKVTVITMQ